jgi:hypothetical protein
MMDEHDEKNLGLTSMPLRLYTCPACSRPIAMTFRPDVEVSTVMWEAASELAKTSNIPLCDPAEAHFPDCQSCGWKPEHE